MAALTWQAFNALAAAFGTTEGTVESHVSSIVTKLGVRSRAQAPVKGMELGNLGATRD